MGKDQRTTRDIVERIGDERFAAMLDVGHKSVARAKGRNQFTASWYQAVCEELAALDEPAPGLHLFGFKARQARRVSSTG